MCVVWCGVVWWWWYGVVWCGVVWCGVVRCGAGWCVVVWFRDNLESKTLVGVVAITTESSL